MKKSAKPVKKRLSKVQNAQMERTFRELASVGGVNSDWGWSAFGIDSEMWQSGWALTSRVRDLFRCNSLFLAYQECVWSNVLGARGPLLRSMAKETEDRVVRDAEKHYLEAHEERRNRVGEFYATKRGAEWRREVWLTISGNNGSSRAKVKVGQLDVYANMLIQRRWEEWQRMEYCDTRQSRNYQTIRQIRLISAIRDGDFFMRMIKDPTVNKFGFALQLINSEWCDRYFNTTLPNGNEVRMGIEYQWSSWGIGKPVAYYFIKRQPNDWQFSIPGAFNFVGAEMHVRVPAEEIIHYWRAVDGEQTRPAPWVASTIPASRQLDQAMLAEVIAWREAACKTGFYESDVVADQSPWPLDSISKFPTEAMGPGDKRALPYGWHYKANDPKHPNADVADYRKASLQNIVAGMPGANYSTMANDYEAINYSAGQLQRLDSNENYMLLQRYDEDYGENRVFEAWLKMALTMGIVPLPLQKFEKFNNKTFAYRSWRQVDEVKAATASALRVANHQSNDFIECENIGLSFPEVIEGQAEANMLKEMYGIAPEKTVQSGAPMIAETADASDAADAAATAKKPVKKSAKMPTSARP